MGTAELVSNLHRQQKLLTQIGIGNPCQSWVALDEKTLHLFLAMNSKTNRIFTRRRDRSLPWLGVAQDDAWKDDRSWIPQVPNDSV